MVLSFLLFLLSLLLDKDSATFPVPLVLVTTQVLCDVFLFWLLVCCSFGEAATQLPNKLHGVLLFLMNAPP